VDIIPTTSWKYVSTNNSVETLYERLLLDAKTDNVNTRDKLKNAKETYDKHSRDSVMAPPLKYHPSFAKQDNWPDPNSLSFKSVAYDYPPRQLAWRNDTDRSDPLSPSSEERNRRARSSIDASPFRHRYGIETDIDRMVWSEEGAHGYNEYRPLDPRTHNIHISFQFARVEIIRPWFIKSIFSLKNYRLDSYATGSYSTGTIANNTGIFPIVPKFFIIVRNFRMSSISWSSKDLALLNSSTSGNTSVGWGPFALSGRYHGGISTEMVYAKLEHVSVVALEPQVIAWVNDLLPICPP
jgi:hypothetical protein